MALTILYENECEWLAVWDITESEDDLCSMVTHAEAEESMRFGSPRRRCEWLAWRAALRTKLPGAAIEYNDVGAPVLVAGAGCYTNLGVTHTGGHAIVMLSDKPCAVDAERVDRDFLRAADKFISPMEAGMPVAEEPLFGAAMWCSKEVLYKLAGRNEVDLLADIRVTDLDFEKGEIEGAVLSDSGWVRHRLRMRLYGEMMIVFSVSGFAAQL